MASDIILKDINSSILNRNVCNLMLTGGVTAKILYNYWRENASLLNYKNINYYFGDERCVPYNSADSNYLMAMENLFPNVVPGGCTINRIEVDNVDKESAAIKYEGSIPDIIDVLLLGLGTDGHIASIFPYSPVFNSKRRKVMLVSSPYYPKERITITPKVISESKSIFLLATGSEKGRVLGEALNFSDKIEKLPVRLTISTNWLIDSQAEKEIKNFSNSRL